MKKLIFNLFKSMGIIQKKVYMRTDHFQRTHNYWFGDLNRPINEAWWFDW